MRSRDRWQANSQLTRLPADPEIRLAFCLATVCHSLPMAGLRVKARYVFAVCAPPFPVPPTSQTLGLSSLYSKGGEVAKAAVLQARNSTLPSHGLSRLLCLPTIAVICHRVLLLGPVDLADAGFQLRSPPPPPRASPPPTPQPPYFFISSRSHSRLLGS